MSATHTCDICDALAGLVHSQFHDLSFRQQGTSLSAFHTWNACNVARQTEFYRRQVSDADKPRKGKFVKQAEFNSLFNAWT